MNDKFLNEGRQEPRPEFARSLRERLRAQEPNAAATGRARTRFSPAMAAFASVLVIASLFSIPAVRVSAQSFLDLFRVRKFAGVKVEDSRMEMLRGQQFDVESVLGKPERILDPGPARAFPNSQEAALATGYTLRQPVGMPPGLRADTTWVRGESRTRLRIDGSRMRALLAASLAIDDIQLPPAIDGAEVNVHLMPVARTTYRREGGHEIALIQSPSPEFSLPSGIQMAQLGEIGLRVAGLSPSEARRMSQSIDWHSTLLVPVPGGASSFREVDVRGHKGLLIALDQRSGGKRRLQGKHTQLLWSDGDRVFALVGRDVSDVELLQLANQVQ